MQIFSAKTIGKIKKNKYMLERKLKVKIEIKNKQIFLYGKELNKYLAEKILRAIDRDFPIKIAFLLLNPDNMLEEINIKEFTRKKNLSLVKARIIGTKGKALKTVTQLSDRYFTLKGNTVAIIGETTKIKEAITAMKSLIHGSKHAKVYSYLEKSRRRRKQKLKKEDSLDLGLKI